MPQPQLIHEAVSTDTLSCAQALVKKAEDGEVVGAVIAYLYRGQRYSLALCGLAYDNPTWARGVVHAIDDELYAMIHEHGQSDSTL